MFSPKVALLAGVTAALSAHALSTGCQTAVLQLAIGEVGQCLQLTSLLGVLTGSGTFTDELTNYLGSLCADSTPTCSNSTLESAQSSVSSSCASDIQQGGTNAVEVQALGTILASYPQVYAAACARNETTNTYCPVDVLNTVQNVSGTDVSLTTLTDLLSGGGDNSAIQQAAQSGQLCTGCAQEIYFQALQANASIGSGGFGQTINSTCGTNFGASEPSGIATASAGASSAAAASASPTGGASALAGLPGFVSVAFSGVVALAGLAVGGALVL